MGSPGSADAALTVGAVDKDDKLAPFSSAGPRAGDGAVKPDVTTADGVTWLTKFDQLGVPDERLRLTTSAPSAAAHSMPAMTAESSP